MNLPPDATIHYVLATLAKPVEYVANVYARMNKAQKEHGNIVVRIGVLGTGLIPNYRIDAGNHREPLRAYDGQTHEPFSGVRITDSTNWSTAVMTFEEIRELLGSLRTAGSR